MNTETTYAAQLNWIDRVWVRVDNFPISFVPLETYMRVAKVIGQHEQELELKYNTLKGI